MTSREGIIVETRARFSRLLLAFERQTLYGPEKYFVIPA